MGAPVTILALDLSLTAPGWFRRDDDGTLTHGVLYPKGRGLDRIDWICKQVRGMIPEQGDVHVFIEGFSFGSQGQALYEIAGLGYIIRYMLWYRKIPCTEVAPSQLKKWATGKGNAPKEIIIREVYRRWGVEATDNNHADAVALGRLAMCFLGLDQPTTAEQREVLAALRSEKPAKAKKGRAA